MKNLHLYIIIFIALILSACTENRSRTSPLRTNNKFVPPSQRSGDIQTQPTANTTALGAVQHYTCPNNCVGSGGSSAGTCPVCGTAYAHNQAFHNAPTQTTPTPPSDPGVATVNVPAANEVGVFHYTCANGCAGGAGAQGPCPNCGAELVHNDAYHSDGSDGIKVPAEGIQQQISTSSPTAEPAQNAAGVWHYTCSNGCAGGGGTAVACATCGSTLVHNTAYHQ